MFRLDRTKFKAQTFEEADNQIGYWVQKSLSERLAAANYLIATAWNYELDELPRMERDFIEEQNSNTKMNNIFNKDFQDFIQAMNDCEVTYILVGGYAVILHGHIRTTGDMDIWVERNEENYKKLVKAFQQFGMPTFDMTQENFLENQDMDVFTYGTPPVSIDILTELKGLDFLEAFNHAVNYEIEEIKIRVLDLNDLIKAKKAAGRLKDLDDIEKLKRD